MNTNGSARADMPGQLGAQLPPSILIVVQAPDLRSFLRTSLQQWYQIAETSTDTEAIQHLQHCPPQALIIGPMSAPEEEALSDALRGKSAPPVLKLWASSPPSDWATKTLRHPFMRIELLQAVNQLLRTGKKPPPPTGQNQNGTVLTPK